MDFLDRYAPSEDDISKFPALNRLESLGYRYISPDNIMDLRENLHNPLLVGILRKKLMEINSYEYKGNIYKFDESIINKAIRDLDVDLTEGLINGNRKVYDILLYGKSYEVLTSDKNIISFSFKYIDWENIDLNDFSVTDEFVVEREKSFGNEKNIRPDIVVFVNGIPLSIIECKRSSIAVDQAISQMIRNQGKDFCPNLFKYVQLVMATNVDDVRYATCSTPKKFWSVWHEEDEGFKSRFFRDDFTKQDCDIVSFYEKNRFLEFIRFFTFFDINVKKVARYQQYFGVKSILDRVEERDEFGNRKSGVVWHTQGSGKSLTMVMLCRYIFYRYKKDKPKVVIVTDRVDLDDQIHKTFNDTDLRASKAISGNNLVSLINNDGADIVTTIVNKFKTAVDNIEPVLSKDVFILVDESHRTQYGSFHTKMKKVFPNACYLGFTGTPLMKDEKNTMIKFGDLIHTYTISKAVADGTILPLYYEGFMVDQEVNQRNIDNTLDIITRKLKNSQKQDVMKKWSRFSKIASSDQRIYLIAFRINEHYKENLGDTPFNAMFATNSKVDSIRYLKYFERFEDLNVKLLISAPDMREGFDDIDEESSDEVVRFWKKMMADYGDKETYERRIKDEFIHGDIDILIVVDKLLTGFDAPSAQILYIDKPLKEHNLLQAIARVNRLQDGKDRGIIIDFRGLLSELDSAMNMYSGAGLENFDPKDLEDTLRDSKMAMSELRQSHSVLLDMFINIDEKSNEDYFNACSNFLYDDKLRNKFYENMRNLRRNIKFIEALDSVYIENEKEILSIKKDLKFFEELEKSVKSRYQDIVDISSLNDDMQNLIDRNVSSSSTSRITHSINILNDKEFKSELARLGNKASQADAIRSRLSQSINSNYNFNPMYYEKFSEMIEKTLNEYKDKRITEAEYLEKMYEYAEDFHNEKDVVGYPINIKNNFSAQAYYGEFLKLYDDEDIVNSKKTDLGLLALESNSIIKRLKKVDWIDNEDVKNKMILELEDMIIDYMNDSNLERNYDLIDSIISKVILIAQEREK